MENYKPKFDKIQDGLLDFLNQDEINLDELAILMQEYTDLARLVAEKLKTYVEDPDQAIPKEFQENVIQIAHIKNIADMVRQKLSL